MREPRRPSTAPWTQTPNGIGNNRSCTASTEATEATAATAVVVRLGVRSWVLSDSSPSHGVMPHGELAPRVAHVPIWQLLSCRCGADSSGRAVAGRAVAHQGSGRPGVHARCHSEGRRSTATLRARAGGPPVRPQGCRRRELRASGASRRSRRCSQGRTRVLPDSRSGRTPPGWHDGVPRPPQIDETRQRGAHRTSSSRTAGDLPGRARRRAAQDLRDGTGDGARPGRHRRDLRARPLHRGHGPFGIGQVHAHALHGRPRPPDVGAVATSATSTSATSTTRA